MAARRRPARGCSGARVSLVQKASYRLDPARHQLAHPRLDGLVTRQFVRLLERIEGAFQALAIVAALEHVVTPQKQGTDAVGGIRAARAHAAARARSASRRRSSSSRESASDTVRSCPWKASVQCSAGHLRACSSSVASSAAGTKSSSSRISTGSVAKRHGYGSTLPGLPGQIFVRSSYISPVTRTIPPNAFSWVT